MHKGRTLKRGRLRAILRAAELTVQEFGGMLRA
jgi:hypothetical protein